ncbi:uncharacterized protein K02A2.6 [Exaiptasia diaphana]|uniref:Integrase catalytic domain-containing protein n=1 Tax=Exaiptasia diaphana TaxID=2652724 RepID=A0A913Y1E3_EXADI|nr:uncharacterized protein K02A2.6 [Exaiptasia diaphana]
MTEHVNNLCKSAMHSIRNSPILSLYDPNLPTKVTADSSSYGLGAVLTQQQSDGHWYPVVYASRTLTKAERGYAQIEKEALASTWACSRFQNYLIGLKFTLETDHKPLIPLLGTGKTLDELTPRLQRMKMRLMRFNYSILYVPGKLLYTADTLSRSPIDEPQEDDYTLSNEVEKFVISVIQSIPATDTRLEQIRQHQQEDDVCQTVIKYVKDGWPDQDKLKGILKLYWPHRSTLTVEGGMLLNGIRIVIPPTLRQDILSHIHDGHQGITKCRRRAIHSVWWPGISSNIKELIDNCSVCSKNRKNHPEPLIPTAMPARPWQKVAADLMEFKKEQYLVVIDYYSRYIELARLDRITSKCVIKHMKSIFSRHGVPEILISDNGTNFVSSEFEAFARNYGFKQVTSSLKHSSGNGEVERAVRTVKE